MEKYTCTNCFEIYEYEPPVCPWCLNDNFDREYE